jgi:aspartate oxidase
VQTAQMIVWSALQREESRGGHYRSDFPRPKKAKTHVEV